MIDFNNTAFLKLTAVPNETFLRLIAPMCVPEEKLLYSFKSIRDGVVFTDRRIFAINVQGVTGRKKDFTSLPYSKIQAFSVETAGTLDLDSELELWFSGLGKVRFEFTADAKLDVIARLIGSHIL